MVRFLCSKEFVHAIFSSSSSSLFFRNEFELSVDREVHLTSFKRTTDVQHIDHRRNSNWAQVVPRTTQQLTSHITFVSLEFCEIQLDKVL